MGHSFPAAYVCACILAVTQCFIMSLYTFRLIELHVNPILSVAAEPYFHYEVHI